MRERGVQRVEWRKTRNKVGRKRKRERESEKRKERVRENEEK